MARSYRVEFKADHFVYEADHRHTTVTHSAAQRSPSEHDDHRQERHEARHDERHGDHGHNGAGHHHHHGDGDDGAASQALQHFLHTDHLFNPRFLDLHDCIV